MRLIILLVTSFSALRRFGGNINEAPVTLSLSAFLFVIRFSRKDSICVSWTPYVWFADSVQNVINRIVIECKTGVETFIFTALLSKEFKTSLDKKQKNWFLLSQHLPITVTKSGYHTPQISKQELMVLDDLDDYLIFSNKNRRRLLC